jgi:hypothetical protein
VSPKSPVLGWRWDWRLVPSCVKDVTSAFWKHRTEVNLVDTEKSLKTPLKAFKPSCAHFVKPKSSRLINKIARFLQESFKNLAN